MKLEGLVQCGGSRRDISIVVLVSQILRTNSTNCPTAERETEGKGGRGGMEKERKREGERAWECGERRIEGERERREGGRQAGEDACETHV